MTIKLSLHLTPEQAERLKMAVERGVLNEFGETTISLKMAGESGLEPDTQPVPPQTLGTPDLAVPQTLSSLSGYAIKHEIGRGGLATVYQAVQVALNRFVAVRAYRGETNDFLDMRKTGALMAAASHPNVAQIYDIKEENGIWFSVVEYLDRGTLRDSLTGHGRFTPHKAVTLLSKVSRGVEAAHCKGIVHRNLKPGNVLFDSYMEPKVTDFDLAVAIDDSYVPGLVGTVLYMSPEQCDERELTSASDVWALGVILYECLTGKIPFESSDYNYNTLFMSIRTCDPPSFEHHGVTVPRDLEAICQKCLHKQPGYRYSSAGSLADDLDRFLAGEPVLARRHSLAERAFLWIRRKHTVSTGALIMVALAVLLLGFFLVSYSVMASLERG